MTVLLSSTKRAGQAAALSGIPLVNSVSVYSVDPLDVMQAAPVPTATLLTARTGPAKRTQKRLTFPLRNTRRLNVTFGLPLQVCRSMRFGQNGGDQFPGSIL